ncbi:unnamed protein product [Brassicogethes aeneus]|uniref:Beta-1,4-N-acetylgalactosaminyltransferase n=1 Tax=Brassicogethes aeneus TaxID=1431903 RepID=A0A9P0AT32_BRAAE|nr:unnamed protein product [Brassicogethes aeneus]
MFLKCFLPICVIVLLIAIYFPTRHARHYKYIEDQWILSELITEKPIHSNSNLKTCNYKELIENSVEIEYKDIHNTKEFNPPESGGWYSPKTCTSLVKTAIIIPYRNRTDQLNLFLSFFHDFIQKQYVEYRIIIAEQNDSLPFNRGKMLNYGAKVAMELNYDCLILHDIDLIPLNLGNIYGCTKSPRHMSSSIDTFRWVLLKLIFCSNFSFIFRYNLPYLTLFGGAISIRSDQFQLVNGFSNQYYGWGGEDDDFYNRLNSNKLVTCRFSPKISKYVMLNHKKEKASPERYQKLKKFKKTNTDGVNQLNRYKIIYKDLYTHVYAS